MLQNDLPRPPKIDIEASDREQRKFAPKGEKFARASATVDQLVSLPSLTPFQSEDLADALAELGRWSDASKLDTPKKEFYLKVLEAIESDDSERCDCNRTQGKEFNSYSPRFVLREIFSHRHGDAVLLACSHCDFLNVNKKR